MQELLGRKTIVAHLDFYLEDVNRSDGCTALLCAVRRGDYGMTELVSICISLRSQIVLETCHNPYYADTVHHWQLVATICGMQLAQAGASLTVPSTGHSALHIVLGSMSVDERMLDLLLQYKASPFIPDSTGNYFTEKHHANPLYEMRDSAPCACFLRTQYDDDHYAPVRRCLTRSSHMLRLLAGRTALQLASEHQASKDGLYRQADITARCILKLIRAQNAFVGAVHVLAKPSGMTGWYDTHLSCQIAPASASSIQQLATR